MRRAPDHRSGNPGPHDAICKEGMAAISTVSVVVCFAGDRKQTTLWQIPSRGQDTDTVHGTQKPV